MPELFADDNAFLQRDVDQLIADVAAMPTSQLASVLSYDELSQSGSARTASGSIVQFKNWTGNPLVVNTRVLVLTKDAVNYVIATEETVSGWASVQTVVYRPTTETVMSLRSEDAGKLMITQRTTGEVQVPIPHDLSLRPGQSIDFIRGAAAEVRFLAAGIPGQLVYVNSTPGLRLQSQWSAATLICVAANTYVLVGDLKA